MARYFVYILLCADGSLYTGSTSDLGKRLHQHNGAKAGAHYTKTRRPVQLCYAKACRTLGTARSREAVLKRLTRVEKLALIKDARVHSRATIPALFLGSPNMGKGDNRQQKEKKKPKKEKDKKK